MKIAYCIEGLFNSGGMERIISVKASYLAQKGYDVTIITSHQEGKPLAFPLYRTIHIVDLNVDFTQKSNILFNDIRKEYRLKLCDYLLKNRFDITISTGGMDLYELYKIRDSSEKIAEIHFSYDMYFLMSRDNRHKFISRLLAQLKTWRMVYAAKKYRRFVVLTKRDKIDWEKHCSNVCQIYNPITFKVDGVSTLTSKNVIAVGRLTYQKGFDLLLHAWRYVVLAHPDWTLNIYGDGPDRMSLQNYIDTFDLSNNVCLRGNTCDVRLCMLQNSIYVLSSRFEGFPLSVIEAESCGLPVVAFDCKCGPSELIEDGGNGYLVRDVGDIEGLTRALCHLIDDYNLRKKMGMISSIKVKSLNVDIIMERWIKLFNSLC